MDRTLTKQLSAFFIVGVIATGVHIISAWCALWAFTISAPYANIMGNLIALPVAYLGHSKYTFQSPVEFQRFVVYAANNYVIFILSILTAFSLDYFSINDYVNVLISAMVFPLVSFFLHKHITFRLK